MIERAIISSVVILVFIVLWLAFRYLHMRRANRALALVRSTPSKPTLLYFSSDHCAPCGTQAQYLDILKEEFGGRLRIRHINTDHDPTMAASLGVFTVPTTLIVDEYGEIRHINFGLTGTSKLAQQLEKVI
ncbi:MAG: thioredoxin family protein [Candidatus Promineifilaceae bacterium]